MATKKSRRVRLMNRLIKIFFISFAILIVVAALGTIGYVQVASSNIVKQLSDNPVTNGEDGEEIDSVMSDDEASAILNKKITTVAVFGVDKDGYRTDVNMLVFFHHETAEIDIISIPRDTKVKIPDDIFKEINETRSGVKQNERINAIPAYVNAKERNDVSVQVLENVFGVDVDYFVNMDLDGFKYIVDEIGPITMNVPIDMHYEDLAAEPKLVIDIDAGVQEINGAQAESIIRFRKGYSNADIGRIDTQHLFMEAFMDELLEPENRFNMVGILEAVFVHITTDFKDAVDYLIYLDDLSADKITMYTLPGGGSVHDGSYAYDVEETKELFESILNKDYDTEDNVSVVENGNNTGTVVDDNNGTKDSESTGFVIEVEPIEPIDPASYNITVQNATNVGGLAGRTKDMLEEAGFSVGEATNYDTKTERTIIKVSDREIGELLANYFNNPEVFVDENLEGAEYQVIIAVGSDDSDEQ